MAIAREKQLKHWKREWKVELIEKTNSEWKDLNQEILDPDVELRSDTGQVVGFKSAQG